MKNIALSLLFSLGFCICFGQVFISGSLEFDKEYNNKMYANLVLLHPSDSSLVAGTVNDSDGHFTFSNIDTGNYILRIAAYGYLTHYQTLHFQSDFNVGLIRLVPNKALLEEVSITSEKPIYTMSGEKSIYNVSEDHSMFSCNANDVLQNTPGLEVDAAGNITLRGTKAVTVWINGKPTHLSEEGMKQFIQTMPASSIKRIEVISNPSARYKSFGCIVNIVTDKTTFNNQFVDCGLDASTPTVISPWISYVYNHDKLSINAFGSYCYDFFSALKNSQNQMLDSDSILSHDETYSSTEIQRTQDVYAMFSLDYEIDSANLISVWFDFDYINQNRNEEITDIYNEYLFNPNEYYYSSTKKGRANNFTGDFGFWYEHAFNHDDHTIDISGDYFMEYRKLNAEINRNFLFQPEQNFLFKKTMSPLCIGGSLDINYTLPYSENGFIEAGLSQSYIQDNQVYDWSYWDYPSQQFLSDALRSSRCVFSSYNISDYITIQQEFGGFTMKFGLRNESDMFNGQYPDSAQYNFQKHFINLIPSVHLSYETDNNHNFYLGYVRRCSAPQAQMLSQFKIYDLENYSVGNPALTSSYTHSLEAGWTKYFDNLGSIGLSAYYYSDRNAIDELADVAYNDAWGRIISFAQNINIGSSYTAGGEFKISFKPKKVVNIRFYANLYYNYYNAQFRPNEWVENGMLSYSFRLNLWAKLWKTWDIYATALYKSKSQSLLLEFEPVKSIDLGTSVSFFKKRLTVYLSVSDLFNWRTTNFTLNNPYFNLSRKYKYTSRYISFGFNYRFGSLNLQEKEIIPKKQKGYVGK